MSVWNGFTYGKAVFCVTIMARAAGRLWSAGAVEEKRGG